MRALHRFMLGGVLLLGVLGGCERSHDVRIAAENWPGNAPLFLAHYLQYYDNPDYDVHIIELPTISGIERKLAAGEYDGVTLTLVEAVMLKERGFDVEIVFPFDYSNGADGFVAQREFKSIQELRGKRIGAELNSVSHYLLLQALEAGGLSARDVEIVNVPANQSAVAFAARDVDAVATWEPSLSAIIERYDANLLFSSKEIPGQIVDVLVLRRSTLRTYPQLADQLKSGWDRALDYYRDQDEDAVAIMAAVVCVPPDEFRHALSGIELLHSGDMARDELAERRDDVRQFLSQKGLVPRRTGAMASIPAQ